MQGSKKSCDTCAHSYMEREDFRFRQKCRNPKYNSPDYTFDMFMEDRERGYCRFWSPETRSR